MDKAEQRKLVGRLLAAGWFVAAGQLTASMWLYAPLKDFTAAWKVAALSAAWSGSTPLWAPAVLTAGRSVFAGWSLFAGFLAAGWALATAWHVASTGCAVNLKGWRLYARILEGWALAFFWLLAADYFLNRFWS